MNFCILFCFIKENVYVLEKINDRKLRYLIEWVLRFIVVLGVGVGVMLGVVVFRSLFRGSGDVGFLERFF